MSRTRTLELLVGALGDDLDVALLAGEPVLDGVRHELGERERERRRVLARQRAEASRSTGCAPSCCGADATSATSLQHAVEDLVEVDVLR